jgi:cyclopropane fatty-acyl-phospholipid synthase-like methyltransferase
MSHEVDESPEPGAEELSRRLTLPRYPRSARYDARFVVEHMMGPNPLWLTEALTSRLAVRPTERVLDLGCGRALSSIFLAREFGVRVEAVDLWVGADGNQRRIEAAGLADRIVATRADALALPFGDEIFDAIVSVDAFHCFGTAEGVLESVTRVLRPGGRIGIVVPGLDHEVGTWPEHLLAWWEDGFSTFHSPEWWRDHWSRTGSVVVGTAEWLADGHDHWLVWSRAVDDWARSQGREPYEREVAMLEADHDHLLGFVVLTATKPGAE